MGDVLSKSSVFFARDNWNYREQNARSSRPNRRPLYARYREEIPYRWLG